MALTAAVVVLFVAGLQKNAQITLLRDQGVAVEVTVSDCFGLMGGSGSNLTGYECRGTFTLDGHRYDDPIPGGAPYSPGTTLQAVSVPEDPALLSTPRAMAAQQASWRVFVLPVLLLTTLACSRWCLGHQARKDPPGVGSNCVGHRSRARPELPARSGSGQSRRRSACLTLVRGLWCRRSPERRGRWRVTAARFWRWPRRGERPSVVVH